MFFEPVFKELLSFESFFSKFQNNRYKIQQLFQFKLLALKNLPAKVQRCFFFYEYSKMKG